MKARIENVARIVVTDYPGTTMLGVYTLACAALAHVIFQWGFEWKPAAVLTAFWVLSLLVVFIIERGNRRK